MPKILTSSSNHFVPILKTLAGRGWEIATIHPQLAQTLGNQDIRATPLANMASQKDREESLRRASHINADLLRNGGWSYEGLLPAVAQFIRRDYATYTYIDLPDIIMFVLLLDKYKPDIIILHNDVEQVNRAAALWARSHGAPALHIPHAIYHNTENAHDIHRIISATHLASAGPFQSAWYANCGFEPHRIYETGLPQFDKMATLALDKKRAKAALGLDQRQPVLCYASSWRQDTNLAGMHDGVWETYEAVLECAKALPEVRFIIKTHPNGNNAPQHLELAQKRGAEVTITANHLPQCLLASDMLLAYGPSNTILEGAHIPWLRLACTSGYEPDYEVHKITTDPPDVEKMVAAITAVLSRPPLEAQRIRSKYLGPCDGRNHERVTALIEGLIVNGN